MYNWLTVDRHQNSGLKPGPEVIKRFSYSTQLSIKFFVLINVKMPTIVGILTFMSRKNSLLHLSEHEKCWISWYFHTYEYLNFMLNWVEHEKSFITSGPGVWCMKDRITIWRYPDLHTIAWSPVFLYQPINAHYTVFNAPKTWLIDRVLISCYCQRIVQSSMYQSPGLNARILMSGC